MNNKAIMEFGFRGIYIDYFMVSERVRCLFTSCEESQTNELVFERVSLRFFTTSKKKNRTSELTVK